MSNKLPDYIVQERAIRREEYIQENAYDGRLAPKIIPCKKKEKSKRRCRERIPIP